MFEVKSVGWSDSKLHHANAKNDSHPKRLSILRRKEHYSLQPPASFEYS